MAAGPPTAVPTLDELRQIIAQQRGFAARLTAQITSVGAGPFVYPYPRVPEDYTVEVRRTSVAWGPGELIVDHAPWRTVKLAEGAPDLDPLRPYRYCRARNGRMYVIEDLAITQPAQLQSWARATAIEQPEPDGVSVDTVESALQLSAGEPASLAGFVAPGLQGDGARITRETLDGLGCIRVDVPYYDPTGYISTWFAPERGYLAVRRETALTHKGMRRTIVHHVREFAQLEGVGWFPARIEYTSYRLPHGRDDWWLASLRFSVIRGLRVLPERHQLFEPWLPSGTVLERLDGTREIVGGDVSDLVEAMVSGDLLVSTPATPVLLGGLDAVEASPQMP